MLLETTGAVIESAAFRDLRIAYVFLSAYYFLLDATVDEHLYKKTDALYLTHLLSASCLLFCRVCYRLVPNKVGEIQKDVFSHVAGNAWAVRTELEFQKKPLEPNEEDEFDSVVGRSNSVLLLYRIIAKLTGTEVKPQLVKLLNDLVFFIQLGDDLGDWRIDFRAQRWTSTIRSCFHQQGRILSEAEMEQELYLSGFYEQRSARIINGLNAVLFGLESSPDFSSHTLLPMIRKLRERVYGLLTDMVSVKLSFYDEHA